jgi:hypothetical protein
MLNASVVISVLGLLRQNFFYPALAAPVRRPVPAGPVLPAAPILPGW